MIMELRLNDFEGFEGHVVMKVPTNTERYELMDELGIDLMEIAGGKKKKDSLKNVGTFKNIIKMIKLSEQLYKEVKLQKDGKQFKSYEDLNEDIVCQSVMISCAQKSVMGLSGDEAKKSKS